MGREKVGISFISAELGCCVFALIKAVISPMSSVNVPTKSINSVRHSSCLDW